MSLNRLAGRIPHHTGVRSDAFLSQAWAVERAGALVHTAAASYGMYGESFLHVGFRKKAPGPRDLVLKHFGVPFFLVNTPSHSLGCQLALDSWVGTNPSMKIIVNIYGVLIVCWALF